MQEEQVGVHDFKLIVSLENIGKAAYTPLVVTFRVTITHAICDCTMLKWDLPAIQSLSTTVLVEPSPTLTIVHATANAASKTLHPAIRKCYFAGQNLCSETTELKSVIVEGLAGLPVFITRAVNVLTIAATNNN
jgi:hypothetical protein